MARKKPFSIPKTSTGIEDRGQGRTAEVSIPHLSTFPTVWTKGNAFRVCHPAPNPSALVSQLSSPQRLPGGSVDVHVPSTEQEEALMDRQSARL